MIKHITQAGAINILIFLNVYHHCLCYVFNKATMAKDQELIWYCVYMLFVLVPKDLGLVILWLYYSQHSLQPFPRWITVLHGSRTCER